MTIAQELREEGRKVGLAEGTRKVGPRRGPRRRAASRAASRADRRLFSASSPVDFGRLPKKSRERVLAASASELDTWLDRAVDAPTLDAVFSTH